MTLGRSEQEKPDKRKAFRFSLWTSRQAAVLKAGRRSLAVRMLDGSARGFSVVTDRDPKVAVDDLLELQTPSGRFEVRVAHVHREVPGAAAAEEGPKPRELTYRIGLERVRDLTSLEDEPLQSGWLDSLRPRHCVPALAPLVVTAIVFALVIVGVPTIGGVLIRHSESSSTGKRPDRAAPSVQAGEPATGMSPLASDTARVGSAAYSAGHPDPSWSPAIRRLPGATALLLGEVIARLRLTDSQQAEIRRIVDSTNEALRQVGERWPGDTRQQQFQKRSMLLSQARRQALQVLTPEQRAQWEALEWAPGVERPSSGAPQ